MLSDKAAEASGRAAENPLLEPERILAIKLADFGDALLTTPALRAVRRRFPHARLDVVTTPAAATAYEHCGLVDAVVGFDKELYDRPRGLAERPLAPLRLGARLRAGDYDAVLLFHHLTTLYGSWKHAALVLSSRAPVRVGLARPGSRRAWFLTRRAADPGFDGDHAVGAALAVAEQIGARTDHLDLNLAFQPGAAAEAQAAALLAAAPAGSPLVVVHPGAGTFAPSRRWPAERFAEVARTLHADGAHVVLVGTADDDGERFRGAWTSGYSDLTGRTDWPTLGAVLARAQLFIGNDSGVMHLATAMARHVVAVFGPSNPIAWGPWWPGGAGGAPDGACPHEVVKLDLPCQPCFYRGYRLGSPAGCPTRDCLSWLGVGPVLKAARRLLVSGGTELDS